MKKYIKSALLLLIAGFLGTSLTYCTKLHENPKTPELPPITHEGKNTFGCVVDGEIFAIPFETSHIQCEYYFDKSKANYGTFALIASTGNMQNGKGFTYHNYEGVFDTGFHKMDRQFFNNKYKRRTIISDATSEYYCTEEMFGSIHITYIDTINKIISGTFEFDAVNENNNTDTIRVRDGRFDCGKFIY